MRKITVLIAALAAFGMMATAAWAGPNVSLTLSSSSVAVGASAVTVTAVADGTINHNNARVRIDRCEIRDDGVWTGTFSDASTCLEDDVEGDGPRWRDMESSAVPFTTPATPVTLQYSFSDTALPGSVGFRARYRPGDVTDAEAGTAQTRTTDLTITASSESARHQGCNGIENASTKVKAGGKAAEKLAEIAERFNCDE